MLHIHQTHNKSTGKLQRTCVRGGDAFGAGACTSTGTGYVGVNGSGREASDETGEEDDEANEDEEDAGGGNRALGPNAGDGSTGREKDNDAAAEEKEDATAGGTCLTSFCPPPAVG